MIVLNILTLRRISKPQAIENSLSEQQRQQRRNRIKSAVKMVLYSLLVYTCCYLPGFLSVFVNVVGGTICTTMAIRLTFVFYYFLPLINSCLSPVIYCTCLCDFREAAKNLLCSSNANIQENIELQQRNTATSEVEAQADNQENRRQTSNNITNAYHQD